ncbi:hypothetical protein LCGC14_0363520 [marine sediment metagenome]|uniref:Uncharacterized protein n=1 Tax=marine sediment metagenome TaxID=412755 RepID=A0A0F9T7G5_9ZZZZ
MYLYILKIIGICLSGFVFLWISVWLLIKLCDKFMSEGPDERLTNPYTKN